MALDKMEYVQKMEILLSNTETYKLLTHDAVNKVLMIFRKHKIDYPLRIIVSSVERPLYNITILFFKLHITQQYTSSKQLYQEQFSFVSTHFCNLTISDNEFLLFLDVDSLFINVHITIDLIFEGIERRWIFHFIERKTFPKIF